MHSAEPSDVSRWMSANLATAALILGLAGVFRIGRIYLAGVDSPLTNIWSSQVIFGLYFAVLTLAVRPLLVNLRKTSPGAVLRTLLLLVLTGLCSDLVLVNVYEIERHQDASYGLVIIWDIATFFVWLRAIELSAIDSNGFEWSYLIGTAPLLKLGREILFIPYSPPADRAYADFVFGDIAVCCWLILFSASRLRNVCGRSLGSVEHVTAGIVLFGCLYWIISAIESITFLAWYPLHDMAYRVLASVGLPGAALNCCYAVMAFIITCLIAYRNAFGLRRLIQVESI